MRPIRVLMVGPGLRVKGGISSVEKLLHQHIDQTKVRLIQLATTFDHPRIVKLFHGLLCWLLFPLIVLIKRPKIVHIHFSSRGSTWRKLPIAIWSRIMLRRVILHCHGSEYQTFFNNSKGLKRRLIRLFLKLSSSMIVLSHEWSRFFKEDVALGKVPIHVMKNPVLLPEISVKHSTSPVILSFSGRIGSRKGTWDLLDAIALLKEKGVANHRLVVTGDGEIDKARRLVSEKGLQEVVEIHGWLSDDRFQELRETSSIFILPSYNEGLPMAMIEAMSLGQIPITTSVGGIPDVIEDGSNGLLVELGTPSSIAAAIEQLITDEDLRERLSEAALATSREHDVVDYVVRLSDLYSAA